MRLGHRNPIRQRPSRPALDERAHHRRVRGSVRDKTAKLLNARHRAMKSSSPRNSTAAINLVAHSFGSLHPAPRPGRADQRNGTPRQYRALADAARPHTASSSASQKSPMAARLDMPNPSPPIAGGWPRRPGRPSPICRNVLGTYTPAARLAALAARIRRKNPVRRQPIHRAPRRSTCRRSAPISSCSPATNSTAPPASACSGANAANGSTPCRPSWAAAT